MADIVKHAGAAMSFADIREAAAMVAESGLFPAWNTPAKAATLMMLCQAEGKHPIQAMNRYDNIQGRVSKKPQAMLDDFIAAGGRVDWKEHDHKTARAIFTAPNGDTVDESFTWADAVTAELAKKDIYKKHPASMLRARCISRAMRMVYPGATQMMYTPDETEDSAPVIKNVTPAVAESPMFASVEVVGAEPEPEPQAPATADEIEAFLELCGGVPAVDKFLDSINWPACADLSDEQTQSILDRGDSFAAKVTAFNEQAEG